MKKFTVWSAADLSVAGARLFVAVLVSGAGSIAAAATETGSEKRVLEEVVVTATKREESLRDIPQSITAFSGRAIEDAGIQGVADIVKLSPGVNFFSDGSRTASITMRGISSGPGQSQTSGMIWGNVSLTDPYLQQVTLDPNPFDLQNVEVLKGPQGTLFGASALGGAIRFVPQTAAFGVWEVKYFAQRTSVEYGGSAPVFGAAVNIPLGDGENMALRLVAIDREEPGYVDDTRRGLSDVNTLSQFGYRGIFAWQPDANWDINLLYAYQEMTAPDDGFTDNTEGRLSRNNTPRASPTDNEMDMVNLTVSYAYEWATLTSDTALVKKEVHYLADQSRLIDPNATTVGLQLDTYSLTETVTQEFRLTSPSDSGSPWRWVAGVFAMDGSFYADIRLPYGEPLLPGVPSLPGGLLRPDGRIEGGTILVDADLDELAVFGDVTRQFGESWELSLGARYYRTNSGGTSTKGGALFLGTSVNDENVAEKGLNPKLSLSWHANEHIMSYAAVTRGYRIGGLQPGVVTVAAEPEAPKTFKSDTLKSYEVGVRTEWFDNTLWFDLTAFFLDWEDAQTRVRSPTDTVSNYITNVGQVQGKGVEASVQWLLPIDGLSLRVGVSSSETVTTEPLVISPTQTVPEGTSFPLAPEWQSVSSLVYEPRWGAWQPRFDITHTRLGEANNTVEDLLPVYGYDQWDANFSLRNDTISWLPKVSLIVTNVKDHRGMAYRYLDNDIGYIRPRAITFRLSGDF